MKLLIYENHKNGKHRKDGGLSEITLTVLPRKERHAGISEGDHFHINGLMVLYRHAGISEVCFSPKFLSFFLHFISFKYD